MFRASLLSVCSFLLLGAVACSHLSDHSPKTDKAQLYLQLSSDMFAQHNYSKAIEYCNQSIEENPEFAAAYNHLGIILMETKRFSKAEKAFKKALVIQPKYPEVFNNLGVLMNRQERFSEAIQNLNQALKTDSYVTPENALTNLGYSYFRLGKLPQAKAYHQKALDVLPDFCLANKNMGDVFAKEKKYSKSADYYNRALATCPLYEESHYKLGLALMKMGQRNTARAELEKLLKRHKSGAYVQRSQEVLKYLE